MATLKIFGFNLVFQPDGGLPSLALTFTHTEHPCEKLTNSISRLGIKIFRAFICFIGHEIGHSPYLAMKIVSQLSIAFEALKMGDCV